MSTLDDWSLHHLNKITVDLQVAHAIVQVKAARSNTYEIQRDRKILQRQAQALIG